MSWRQRGVKPDRVPLNLMVDPELKEAIRQAAQRNRQSMNAWVAGVLEREAKKEEKDSGKNS